MAACVAGVSAFDSTGNAAVTTASFTPASGDLLVAFAVVTGQGSGGTFTDSQGLGWFPVSSAVKQASADTLVCAVSNTLAANSGMTVTFTPAGSPTSTGAAISVIRVSGMSRKGASAILQTAKQENALSAGTPNPTFVGSVLTGNPTIGAVGTTGANNQTEPASWTEIHDVTYAIPGTGLETVARDSGFTGNQITWGASSLGNYCDIIIELDTTTAPFAVTQLTLHSFARPRASRY